MRRAPHSRLAVLALAELPAERLSSRAFQTTSLQVRKVDSTCRQKHLDFEPHMLET